MTYTVCMHARMKHPAALALAPVLFLFCCDGNMEPAHLPAAKAMPAAAMNAPPTTFGM